MNVGLADKWALVVGEPSWPVNGAHLRVDGGAADAVT
jgi:hypothetical protein